MVMKKDLDVASMLQRHIAAVEGKVAVFGVDDCSPWADAWQAQFTGRRVVDPDWHSWEEAEAKIRAAGSLCALWNDALLGSDLWETGAPVCGDVGIIETRVAGQVSGIFMEGGYFAWRIRDGVRILMPRSFVKAWSFER